MANRPNSTDAEMKPELDGFGGVFRDQRVLVTGHTGFKGSWLCEWLLLLGADVTGFSLPPPTEPSLFDQLGLQRRIRHVSGDVRDRAAVSAVVTDSAPAFVFHLAAQPLVRQSYIEPVETYATNVMGTAHVLEAIRRAAKPCVVIAVTTDKCYENREDGSAYNEEDPMGGHDPYSSSKGATELLISAYRRSYFSEEARTNGDAPDVRLASVRAGNVIGGGDWALDRIVPDCIRSLQNGGVIPVRNKIATRPWQHVLEPLSGYLWLAACLHEPRLLASDSRLHSAFNFGPSPSSNRTVKELVEELLKHWPGRWEDRSDPKAVHEAKLLNLSTDKAGCLLKWRPVWDFQKTIAHTAGWYRDVTSGASATEVTTRQIAAYIAEAQAHYIPWSVGKKIDEREIQHYDRWSKDHVPETDSR